MVETSCELNFGCLQLRNWWRPLWSKPSYKFWLCECSVSSIWIVASSVDDLTTLVTLAYYMNVCFCIVWLVWLCIHTFGFSFEALLTQIVSGARVAAILSDGAVPLPPVHQCMSFTHSRSGHSSDLARMTMECIGLLVHGVCWLPTVCGLIELLQCANCTCLCNSMLRYNCI